MNKEQNEATERLLSDSEARNLGRSYLQDRGNKSPSAEEEALIGGLLTLRKSRPTKAGEKFKLTFKNSWWQFLVAILLYKPILIILEILTLLLLDSLHIQLDSDIQSDMYNGLNIFVLIGVYYIGRHLAFQTWKRKVHREL